MTADISTPSHDPLSDAEIERARLLVGVPFVSGARHPVTVATEDAIRNYVRAYGDDNPIYCDPKAAAAGRWGGIIGPGIMAGLVNAPLLGDAPDPELLARTQGLFENCHGFVSGGEWLFYAPIRPGDVLYTYEADESVEAKPSKLSGRAVHVVRRRVKFNQAGQVVAVNRMRRIYSPKRPASAGEKAKAPPIAPAQWGPEDRARLEALYAAETRRGADRRSLEDVTVGEALPAMIKGPLTVTEIIVFMAAGGFGLASHLPQVARLGYEDRRDNPRFYGIAANGAWDVGQRLHWDEDYARSLSHPGIYDYGVMREAYVHHVLTNWCGDDGWVVRQACEMRRFAYGGDVQTITGEVTALREADGLSLVDIALTMRNQRDEVTVTGEATVALPSKAGDAVLPPVPEDLQRLTAQLLRRNAELAG
jgi:acyl dehydratase